LFNSNELSLCANFIDFVRVNEKISNEYLCYLLSAMYSIGINKFHFNQTTGIQNLDTKSYLREFIPLPPLPVQSQIVNFLDTQVSKIDKLIEAKRRQIELLKEWKRATINECLNQDLQDLQINKIKTEKSSKSLNQQNPDSGNEKLKEGWIEKPLKYWVKSNLHSLGNNTNEDFEFDYLDISSIGHGYVKQLPEHFTFKNAPSRARRIVKYGDTIISTVRTYLRSVCFINHEFENCIVSTGFSVLTPNEKEVMPEFLSYILSTDSFIENVIQNSIGVSYPAINDDKLMNLKIALPISIDKQRIIFEIIDEKCTQADRLLAKLQDEISLFAEYKTRLKNDVVTGKVDIQNSVVTSVIKSVVTQPQVIDIVPKQNKSHSKGYEDAVILAALVNVFGTEEYPFTSFDCQKFPYLLHRHIEGVAENYGKFAAGPYNPELKYKTARPIALKKKYIKEHTRRYKGFIADTNSSEAVRYFLEWYSNEPLDWIKQFRFIKNRKNELELLTTVDMAIVELRENSLPIIMPSVKNLIKKSPAWKDKLTRPIFSDENIERAIKWSNKLFGN
jgi:type I restriction enzyme S subunit